MGDVDDHDGLRDGRDPGTIFPTPWPSALLSAYRSIQPPFFRPLSIVVSLYDDLTSFLDEACIPPLLSHSLRGMYLGLSTRQLQRQSRQLRAYFSNSYGDWFDYEYGVRRFPDRNFEETKRVRELEGRKRIMEEERYWLALRRAEERRMREWERRVLLIRRGENVVESTRGALRAILEEDADADYTRCSTLDAGRNCSYEERPSEEAEFFRLFKQDSPRLQHEVLKTYSAEDISRAKEFELFYLLPGSDDVSGDGEDRGGEFAHWRPESQLAVFHWFLKHCLAVLDKDVKIPMGAYSQTYGRLEDWWGTAGFFFILTVIEDGRDRESHGFSTLSETV